MSAGITKQNVLFEVSDCFGTMVRTTRAYWIAIKTEKHKELTVEFETVVDAIKKPDEVYFSNSGLNQYIPI